MTQYGWKKKLMLNIISWVSEYNATFLHGISYFCVWDLVTSGGQKQRILLTNKAERERTVRATTGAWSHLWRGRMNDMEHELANEIEMTKQVTATAILQNHQYQCCGLLTLTEKYGGKNWLLPFCFLSGWHFI